jgi:hypothetical protein
MFFLKKRATRTKQRGRIRSSINFRPDPKSNHTLESSTPYRVRSSAIRRLAHMLEAIVLQLWSRCEQHLLETS